MLQRHTLTLLKQVKELELIAKKNTTGLLCGNYVSTILGHGLEFHEARKYVQGESIRLIDWNMTARLGDVYVKKLREEREREVFLAVDVSPSMFFGSQQRLKYELALEIAATLGFSAIHSDDRLGMVSFADTVTASFLPKKGKSHFFAILKSLMQQKHQHKENIEHTAIEEAIHFIQGKRGKKFMIFFISDFIERDIPDDLRLIQDRHDVVLIHVFDPLEYLPCKRVFLPFYSPEGRRHSISGKPGQFGTFPEVESFLKGNSLKYGIDVLSLSTRDNVTRRLAQFFKEKASRR